MTATDDRHGLVLDLDERKYHADRESLSVSGAKVLLKSPAKFRWQQDHPVFKDVFDFGTAAHRLVLGVGAELVVHEYDAEKVKSPKATKAWKEEQAEVRKRGAVLLLPDEYATVQAMADQLSGHRAAMALLSNGKPEVSAYALDEPTGIMRRCRFDWLGEDMLTDYKTAVSCEVEAFGTAAARYGYHQQAAWYTDVAYALDLDPRGFVFIVQEKEPPYEVACIELDPDAVERGRTLNRRALERFRDCTESGLWPGAVPDNTIARADIPRWAYYDQQEIA